MVFLFLASFLKGEEELSIEAFWLGEERFKDEVAPNFDDKVSERNGTDLSVSSGF